jgi:hypothetical protein
MGINAIGHQFVRRKGDFAAVRYLRHRSVGAIGQTLSGR